MDGPKNSTVKAQTKLLQQEELCSLRIPSQHTSPLFAMMDASPLSMSKAANELLNVEEPKTQVISLTRPKLIYINSDETATTEKLAAIPNASSGHLRRCSDADTPK
eukprot:scaffold3210_cov132-Skeletonema_dohrnii-CCMP3373.AAC.2